MIAELKKQIDLLGVVEAAGVELTQRGGSRRVDLCLFHTEKTPSFYVFQDNHFKRFDCGESGDSIGSPSLSGAGWWAKYNMVIIIDTREQRPFKFNKYDAVTEVKEISLLVYKNITFKSTDTIPSEIAGTASKKVA